QPFASTPDKFYFPETRHSLGGFFKRVWEERGGLTIFGYPISEEFPELSETDGLVHIVQYFERNRFEYHSDFAGTEDEVMLGHLAREILIRRGWLDGALT
ncbi:MAG: peptidoglycan hydrolase, partial [Thermomicrobiales bacterium]